MKDALAFTISGRTFSVELTDLEGVVEAEEVFFIPHASPPVLGMVAYRGEPVVVADVGGFFGLKVVERAPCVIIVAGDGKKSIGLAVTEVKPSVLWKEEIKEAVAGKEKYVSQTALWRNETVNSLDWKKIYGDVLAGLSQR